MIAGMHIHEAQKSSGLSSLDTDVLLAHVLRKDRSWVTAHPEYVLTDGELTNFLALCKRRHEDEPIAHLTGLKDFFGRPFQVNSSVLIPRPSTEQLIDLAVDFLEKGMEDVRDVDTQIIVLSKKTASDFPPIETVVDIGTGSGCIAVTLACEKPNYHYIATDISNDALVVASENAKEHNVSDRVKFLHGDLLDPVQDITSPFIVVTNPPYIPSTEKLMRDVQDYEPHLALFGGDDGADFVRVLWREAWKHPACFGVVMECRSEHAPLREYKPTDTIES